METHVDVSEDGVRPTHVVTARITVDPALQDGHEGALLVIKIDNDNEHVIGRLVAIDILSLSDKRETGEDDNDIDQGL